jgi:hypothetical protein
VNSTEALWLVELGVTISNEVSAEFFGSQAAFCSLHDAIGVKGKNVGHRSRFRRCPRLEISHTGSTEVERAWHQVTRVAALREVKNVTTSGKPRPGRRVQLILT